MKKKYYLNFIVLLFVGVLGFSQNPEAREGNPDNLPEHEYTLTLKEEMVNKAGKDVMGMTVNGGIPGPILNFKEGEYAVIYVKNDMSVETSIHWHGMILPNFFDGVPYLTTPPIEPGHTFKYEFPINQSGTYWYHSHTMLQEQSGVFGSIVIQPKEKTLDYDKELVLMLSDWTNEKPKNVLRNLKRGNEWYSMKKGTSTPLNQVIARGALGAQVDFWRQRMEGADIADVYYPAFLINGEEKVEYPEFKAGEKVRLRIIDGSASTSFWMTFGGETPTLISADGLDVVPVKKNKTFIGVAETYDFIVEIPQDGKIEFRITAQDGSGTASSFLGSGKILEALDVPRPDKIAMMQKMAKMKMKMGAPALKANPGKDERYEMKEKYGMQMDGMQMDGMQMDGMNHSKEFMNKMNDVKPALQHKKPKDTVQHNTKHVELPSISKPMDDMDHTMMRKDTMNMDHSKMEMKKGTMLMDHSKMDHTNMEMKKDTMMMDHSKMEMKKDTMMMDHSKMDMEDSSKMDMSNDRKKGGMQGMEMFSEYNYDYLKSPEKTTYDKDFPVNEILLNLTGNMNRYIWSMNGVPLSETDKIKIKGGEVTRITLNNLTMMHHPMHLHGHFFRVINENGEYSPLKHTVNVPPMKEITIEFYGDEYGDWFFHCHILYHMMGGMARVISYDTPRDERLKEHPVSKLVDETDMWYSWGIVDAASHMTELNLVTSNIRNQFNVTAEYGWNKNLEAEVSYERYLFDYLRVFGGVNIENEMEDSLEELNTTAIAGIRYLTPYLFNLDVRIDSELRPQISLSREIMIFPRTAIFGVYEYQADFGWVNDLPAGDNFEKEVTWSAGMEYFLSRNFSLMGSYDNRFGAGGGLSIRF
ncbi:multicopper oxidase domain-containing protein [Gillisia sp. CAL575]|uniref:multicopper oxidase domain-containing protein n=1 Tax=Gillisia sp. CAL575 TaxID=985255 RepID=UPI0003A24426|nr:multicopper oxidase domain-containing protein [Gillisia sp. CAL575]